MNRVVFPDPFGPMSPTISPLCTSKSTSERAVRPPKRFVIFLPVNIFLYPIPTLSLPWQGREIKGIEPLNDTPPFYVLMIATARHHPAEPLVSFTGKQATLKPNGFGSLSRLASFSMWQYSRSIPARWASHRIFGSPVLAKASLMAQKGRSHPQGVDTHDPDSLVYQSER